MTPFENATKLFNKYYSNIPETGLQGKYSLFAKHAKQCALICVNELIDDCDASSPYEVDRLDYWSKVKLEIEKL